MLYLELFTELGDHCIVEIRTIVSNNSLWHTISTDQIMSDKLRHNVLGYCGKRGCFNPLREVINDYQDEEGLGWSQRIISLSHADNLWYSRFMGDVSMIDGCGEFPNVPLLGIRDDITYNTCLDL